MNYQPTPPRCKLKWLNPLHLAILREDEIEAQVYASLFRALECAPVEKRLPIFRLAARVAAAHLEARRQQAIDDLHTIADEVGLIRLLGATAVQDAIRGGGL